MNGTHNAGHEAHFEPSRSFGFSDIDGDEIHDDNSADYTTRLEELMSDGDEGSDTHEQGADDEDGEGFFYSGVDAGPAGTYREQLRDVLGPEDIEDEVETYAIEYSLSHEVEEKERFQSSMDDEARPVQSIADHLPPVSSGTPSEDPSPPRVVVSSSPSSPQKKMGPFLHPTISRLRSSTPQTSRTPSAASVGTLNSLAGLSATPSQFSGLSPTSSQSNLPEAPLVDAHPERASREVFRWTQLRSISDLLYGGQTHKVSAVLGTPSVGFPTVIATNGLICIGTDLGKILVFDFRQNLKCVCESQDKTIGAVTSLALSFDHTYVAAGHATGHIQLFDLQNPKSPARFVPPTTMNAVVSGTQEGHIAGSSIVSVGFVAGRHTAIVSADDSGLAFYHSLGKVLFVEASDILRILGKYPDEDPRELIVPGIGGQLPFRRRKARKAHAILSMAPLPLGTAAHPTDTYNLIALLTPVKLVVVGLKPSPKTWYRVHRDADDEPGSKSRFKGVLSWFPNVASTSSSPGNSKPNKGGASSHGTIPMLVYGWGNTLNLVRVSEIKVMQETKNPKNGKVTRVEVGRIVFEEVGRWTIGGDVLALQWLNLNQVIVLTASTLEVYDVYTFKMVEQVQSDAWALVSPVLGHTTNGSMSYSDAVSEVAHSFRVYKGKIFLLGQHDVKVGTLLTWADRILSFVEDGDFLSAIELTRSYYVGEAPGNRNGLPDDPAELRSVVGDKMRELMVASARYAFSEERLTDSTHITADGRGVDRTSLFEGLVDTYALACMALDDFDLLFEDLYGYYDAWGITRIFLLQLEPFVLDGRIHYVPPRITQRLVALHDENNRPDLAERLIWHIDPDCLDINQAIIVCQQYQLYDALIYVYTRAMKDYVSPVVELLGLIRRVMQYRRARVEGSPRSDVFVDDNAIELVIMNAYKIYPYLANVLTGLTYPSEEPIPDEEAFQAKKDVYTFLFFGRSSVWPVGEGGKLVLTSDEENGVEPTYPYTRILLRFDAEAFLHTLDLALEDHYLNDKSQSVSRLVIIKILFEILSTPDIPQSDATFINIFIARNVPKYPQFIQMPPSALHGILIGLADVEDESTREDRQLAAEYLLSVYTPHEEDRILRLFERAGFYRILRSWYRQECQWPPLLETYLKDPDIPSAEVFSSIDDTVRAASRLNKGTLPTEILTTIADALPSLLELSIASTAALVDKRMPDLHNQVYGLLKEQPKHERFDYLRYLLGSPYLLEDAHFPAPPHRVGPSSHIPSDLRQEYVSLLCELEPSALIPELQFLPSDFLDWPAVLKTCEEHQAFDTVVWALNWRGDPRGALAKAETFENTLSNTVVQRLVDPGQESEEVIEKLIVSLRKVVQNAVTICLDCSKPTASAEVPLEDIWFQLLRNQISCVHRVSASCSQILSPAEKGPAPHQELEQRTLGELRSLVQETFASFMTISSSKAVSFPRLFKRLADSVAERKVSKGALYTEFRAILTGMLESYRSDGDMLIITKHLLGRDIYDTVELLAKERSRGWAPSSSFCSVCRKSLREDKRGTPSQSLTADTETVQIVISRTGAISHAKCLPSGSSDDLANSVS